MKLHGRSYIGILRALRHLTVLLVLLSPPISAGSAEPELRKLLSEPDHVLLLRHALAPGTGDPPNFRLSDCASQRNLSPAGREQALRIGNRLRTAGLENTKVYSSQWCRSLDTARGLNIGSVAELPVLNSFFRSPVREREQTEALREWITSADLKRPVVLVTHQVNITALTGIYPAEGEIVVLRREQGALSLVTRLLDE